MKTRKSFFQSEYVSLFFLCTALIFVIFGVYLFGFRPFRIHNDQMFQYPLFYKEWIHLIKDFLAGKGLPLYSWRLFLGSDFYASMVYYVTGDIFLPLFFLFDVDTALIIETVLCFYVSCFTMFGFLKSAGIQSFRNKAFIALIYAFGGWSMLYIGQYMFHRFYAFLPLLFLGVELFFTSGKRWLVCISTAILFLQNYYMMWPLSLGFLGYCSVREKEKGASRNVFFSDAVKLFIAYFCGTMLSGFMFLPAALYVVQNPRVGTVTEAGFLWPLKTMAGFFLSFSVSPFPVNTNISNLFRLDDNGYGYWYSLFITIIPFITSLSWSFKKKHREWGILICILIISALIKPLSVLFHGLSDPSMRWTFILQFILLYTACRALESEEYGNRKLFFFYHIVSILCVIVTALIVGIDKEYWVHYLSVFVCIVLSLFIWYLWTHQKMNAAMLVSIIEIAGYGCLMQNCFYHDIVYDDYRFSGNQLTYLQETDDDLLYRYYIPIEDVEPTFPNLNISLKYDFVGTRTYNSVYDTLTDPFLHLQGIYDHRIDITDPDALTMLGVKYYIVESEAELPDNNFTYLTDLNGALKIYKNENYRGFGYCSDVVGYTESVNDIQTLSRGIYIDDSTFDIQQYQNGESTSLTITAKATNYISATISLDHDNILFFSIPCRKGWKVFVDGIQTEAVSVNGGFLGLPLTAGNHAIELDYVTPGLKVGIGMSAAGVLILIVLTMLDRSHN